MNGESSSRVTAHHKEMEVYFFGFFFPFFFDFFPVFWWKEGARKEGRKEGGTALFALSDARLLLLRSKKGACQLANAFDCLLHFAFTSAPQQYTK